MLRTLHHSLRVLTRDERSRFFRDVLLCFLITVTDIAFMALLFYGAGRYLKQEASFLNDNFSTGFLVLAAGVWLLFILKNGVAYLLLRKQFLFVYKVAARLSALQIRRYLEGDWFQFTGTDASVHTRNISQLPVEYCQYVLVSLQQLFLQGLLLLTAVISLLFYAPLPFLLLAAVLVPASLLLFVRMRRITQQVRNQSKRQSIAALQHLREALSGFAESNVYAANDFFIQRYARSQQALNQQLASIQYLQLLPARFIETISVLGLLLLLLFYKNDQMTAPELAGLGVFAAAAYKIIPGLSKCIGHYSQLMAYAHTAGELTTAVSINQAISKPAPVTELQSVRFEQVCFAFKGKTILDKVSFCIRAGELTGLQALSGKGKTTLLNILLGFLEPDTGAVYFNDKKVRAGERKQYWPLFALVKQDGFFLHDTLARNITLSDEPAEPDWLRAVIRICGLDTLASAEGAFTEHWVTGEGRNISGGQKQRLAIARALYKNAPVLLADEPFNELDEAAERSFVTYFKSLAAQGKMVLLITHNPESLRQCDQIITTDAE